MEFKAGDRVRVKYLDYLDRINEVPNDIIGKPLTVGMVDICPFVEYRGYTYGFCDVQLELINDPIILKTTLTKLQLYDVR